MIDVGVNRIHLKYGLNKLGAYSRYKITKKQFLDHQYHVALKLVCFCLNFYFNKIYNVLEIFDRRWHSLELSAYDLRTFSCI